MLSGSEIRVAAAESSSRLHSRRGADCCARRRCEHRGVQRGRFGPVPAAAVSRCRSAVRPRIGDVRTRQAYGFVPRSAVDAARATGLFDGMASASSRATQAYVRRGDALEALSLTPVSREYLELLGVRPLLGRASTRPTRERAPSCSRTRHGCVTTAATRPSSAVRSRPRSGRWTVTSPTARCESSACSAGGCGFRLRRRRRDDPGRDRRRAPFPPLVRLKPGVTVAPPTRN